MLSAHEGHMVGLKNILYTAKTPFQHVDIVETETYGKCLFLDAKVQSSEADEFIYHELLVHPTMLMHSNPERIMVVGGGEGATLRELLKHKSTKYILMVDIDEEVVRECIKHLPEMHQGAFDDPRVELKYLDARKYLEETQDTFDVIIVDIPEPLEAGPAYLLYTREFYQIVKKRLSPQGTINLQAGTLSPVALDCFCAVAKTLATAFPVVAPLLAAIPCFSLPWGFILASKEQDPRKFTPQQIDDLIAKRIAGELRFYDGISHQGIFSVAKYVRRAIEKTTKVIEDNAPLYSFA
jgi:spermidine synthase